MRVFVAVEIEDEIKERIAALQRALGRVDGVKWVEPKNLHLTLKFLGEIEPGLASRLANSLAGPAAEMPAFRIRLGGTGVFPDARRPRIVWVGLKEGFDELFALAQKVEAAAQELGFAAETRPFKAHLTMGRVRRPAAGKELLPALEGAEAADFGEQKVSGVSIIESNLTPSGPIYTVINKVNLRDG